MQVNHREAWENQRPQLAPVRLGNVAATVGDVVMNSGESSLLPLAVLESALAAALEAIPGPAFVLGEDGVVRRANRASTTVFVRDSHELLLAIAADATQSSREVQLQWRECRYRVTRLSRVISPCMYLAVGHGTESDVQERLGTLGEKWRLSPRQRETLDLLVQGLPNKAIALRLGIAVGTVEIHVSKVLRQAGAESRAALTAKFFSEQLKRCR